MKQDRTAVGTPEFWTGVLNLEGFEVVHHRHDAQENRWQFTVVPRVCAGVCPGCGEVSNAVHQTREWDDVHDLPIGDSRVALRVRVFQFECETCQRCFTPACPHVAEGAHATERFLERAAQLIRTGDVANAAAFFGVPEKTLERWYYAHLKRRQSAGPAAAKPIRSLGIDELALKKGGGVTSR